MKKQRFLTAFVILLPIILISCKSDQYSEISKLRIMDLNTGWKFIKSGMDAGDPELADENWTPVDLPHDWSIEDQEIQDSVHIGPFVKGLPMGQDVGHLEGGTAWYRKKFILDNRYEGKKVFICFDGVQTEMKLWVNGELLGEHVYGYSAFYFDLTPFLAPAGKENVLAVKVTNPGENSRWYPGAGIYRPVSLLIVDPVHLDIWGVKITTPEVSAENADIHLNIYVVNSTDADQDVELKVKVRSPTGEVYNFTGAEAQIRAGKTEDFSIEDNIPGPVLWGLETPELYEAEILVLANGNPVDATSVTFGIRTIEFTAENGFQLNGKEVLLKGGNMHHDNGLIGIAAFPAAEERRVRIMKENGFNAIRTSHNPPSSAFLDACDRFGMLVIDESFDAWQKAKRKNDYHLHFDRWWKQDIQAMVLRDQNHPSIIMWSFGNEIPERGDSSGLAIAAKLIAEIKKLDTTRPVTQAICAFWDNPGKEWDYAQPAFQLLDVGGYNYQWQNYENDHSQYPGRIMYGSESVPKEAWENWNMVSTCSWVIGDFVWTGMDYLGESGIGHVVYKDTDKQDWMGLPPWPWYVAWCGDIDIIGNKKPQSYYRDVLWNESNLEIAVHEPIPEGKFEHISFWGWPAEFQSWNWKGHEGEMLKVRIFSNYPEVKLYLDDKPVRETKLTKDNRLVADFELEYQPGELKAEGLINGEIKEVKKLYTTGKPVRVSVQQETDIIRANRNNIAYFRVSVVDEDDKVVPDALTKLQVGISGEAELLAAGNGSPWIEGSFKDKDFTCYNGKALVIVRSTGKKGEIRVEVNGESIESGSATIRSE